MAKSKRTKRRAKSYGSLDLSDKPNYMAIARGVVTTEGSAHLGSGDPEHLVEALTDLCKAHPEGIPLSAWRFAVNQVRSKGLVVNHAVRWWTNSISKLKV